LLDFREEEKFSKLGTKRNLASISSFITIQEGCDKFCSFCVVPFTRGAEYSRSVEEIVNEAESLCQKGSKELILLGQNVNAYHGLNNSNIQINLAELIKELANINQLERITYTTSHPRDMNNDLINMHLDCEKLNPYLHLPVQSGSDSILKNMNRKYTATQYINIIEKLRKKVPNIAISSDFIVGFPGETKKDFQETLKLVKEVKFAQSYSFKYSRRIGTKANRINCSITEEEKSERLHELQTLLNKQKTEYNNGFINKKVEVLVKGKGKREKQFRGTTKWMQSVIFKCDDSLDVDKVCLKISSAEDNCLLGDLI
jgi:tRNA-2-methylthio-N6-dimethylallyladenosine synthase